MKLFLSALEPSSNLHAKEVVAHLIRLLHPFQPMLQTRVNPTPESTSAQNLAQGFVLDSAAHTSSVANLATLELTGVFDCALFAEFEPYGVRLCPIFSPRDFSIMGFSDVVRRLPFLLRAQHRLAGIALESSQILLMDSSSFHIRLAKRIKSLSPTARICYYILPQLWAWKSWRAKALERYCDKLLGILPFEAACYSQRARESEQFVYVGHPLLDELPPLDSVPTSPNPDSSPESNTKETQLPESTPSPKQSCIVFMPGSRRAEIKRIFPTFYEVAKQLPNTRKLLVIPKAWQSIWQEENLCALYECGAQMRGALAEFELCFDTHSALKQADFGFICSGTATLEAALLGTPFVLAYKAAWLDYVIARCFVHLRVIGLANIFYQALCKERAGYGSASMHEELIQSAMNTTNLLQAYKRANEREFRDNAKALRAYLQTPSAQNVARILLESMA